MIGTMGTGSRKSSVSFVPARLAVVGVVWEGVMAVGVFVVVCEAVEVVGRRLFMLVVRHL